MTTDALWLVDDVARYLKVSRSWVYQRTASGQIPTIRLGNQVRFDPESIRDYARRMTSRPAKVLQLVDGSRRAK